MFELIMKIKIHEWFIFGGMLSILTGCFKGGCFEYQGIKFYFIFGIFFILIGMILSKFDMKLIVRTIKEIDISHEEWKKRNGGT